MKDNGIFDLSGVPGSGKTLTSVWWAKRHYKKENSPIKYYLSYFKYKVAKNGVFISFKAILNKFSFFNIYNKWCLSHNSKVDNILKKVLKLLYYFIKFFVYIFLFIFIFVCNNNFYRFLIVLFFIRKKILYYFNSLDYEYYSLFPYHKINNVYSSFPILLDKKLGIYSNKTSIWQWNNDVSFLPNSLLISDEIQLFIDSDEYSDKRLNKLLKRISNFLQAHRHFAIKNVLLTAQSPSRIFKKAREICSGYIKLHKVIKIPFLPFGIIRGTIYYDLDYYGKYIPRNREERSKLAFDYKKFTRFVNLKSIYSSYDSRYLAQLNYSKPLSFNGSFTSLRSDFVDLSNIFKRPIVSDDFNEDIFDVKNNDLSDKRKGDFFTK